MPVTGLPDKIVKRFLINESRTFKPGAEVMLKSGGPSMTVERVVGDEVDVAYFEGPVLQRKMFALGMVRAYIAQVSLSDKGNNADDEHLTSDGK